MTSDLKLKLTVDLTDQHGTVHGRIHFDVGDDVAFHGWRQLEEARLGLRPGDGPFGGIVELMQRREVRKDMLEALCAKAGRALGEHLEDREGWHGVGRQEKVEGLYDGYPQTTSRSPKR